MLMQKLLDVVDEFYKGDASNDEVITVVTHFLQNYYAYLDGLDDDEALSQLWEIIWRLEGFYSKQPFPENDMISSAARMVRLVRDDLKIKIRESS